jgi:NAD(P)-dependent dehydrogenase (short-subunit alcohol dehydrogenase family)
LGKTGSYQWRASGIGRYVAKTFAQEQARVVVADIKPLDTISAELAAMEVDFMAVPTDVQDEAAVRKLMDQTMDRFGRIDVLHNNAAIVTHFHWGIPHWPRIRDLDPAFWDRVIRTNLGGTFLCTKYALPHMEAQRSGHIINTTGGSGQIGASPYQVSKDAIRSFTKAVAEEEREFNICIVGMSPGARIATEEASEEARARYPGPEFVGTRFVLAAQVGMEYSGKLLTLDESGKVVVSRS